MTPKEKEFKEEVFKEDYDPKMLNDFFDYWSEPNKKGKMKFELEKTWDTPRRLKRWFNNQKQWNGSTTSNAGPKGTSEARTERARNW